MHLKDRYGVIRNIDYKYAVEAQWIRDGMAYPHCTYWWMYRKYTTQLRMLQGFRDIKKSMHLLKPVIVKTGGVEVRLFLTFRPVHLNYDFDDDINFLLRKTNYAGEPSY